VTDRLTGLPGEDLVRGGLRDLERGHESAEATLVRLASRQLRAHGFPVTAAEDAELRLYRQLGTRFPDRDPFAIYAAWLDTLHSFLAAYAARARREASGRAKT
jgi:hypothetical protein